MKKFFKSHHGSVTELNITPLLDLVIVLLMIFIIAAPQLANDLELNLPSAQPPPPSAEQKKPAPPNYINVSAAGEVTLNNQRYELEPLRLALVQLRTADPKVTVVVRGNEEADYEMVVGVLDVLQQAQIERIGLATETGVTTSVQ